MCPLPKEYLSKTKITQLRLKPTMGFYELLKHFLFIMSSEQESIKILIYEWNFLMASFWILTCLTK